MLIVETIARIRREHFIKGKTIKEIARDLKVSRNTIRKVLRSGETSFEYEREVQPRPKLGRWAADLDGLLASNVAKSAREQLTLIRIFEELRGGSAEWRDGDREGCPCPALSQPHAVCAVLSARDSGDGVRRPRPGVRPIQGHLRTRHLRQYEDRRGDDLRRQRASLQSPLHADVQPLPG